MQHCKQTSNSSVLTQSHGKTRNWQTSMLLHLTAQETRNDWNWKGEEGENKSPPNYWANNHPPWMLMKEQQWPRSIVIDSHKEKQQWLILRREKHTLILKQKQRNEPRWLISSSRVSSQPKLSPPSSNRSSSPPLRFTNHPENNNAHLVITVIELSFPLLSLPNKHLPTLIQRTTESVIGIDSYILPPQGGSIITKQWK